MPDDLLIGATVDVDEPADGQMKVMSLVEIAAAEAVGDAVIDFSEIDRCRFGCSLAGHMGDITCYAEQFGLVAPHQYAWWNQFLPNTTCSFIAGKFGLLGPRFSHSTACATSLISFITAVRSIRDGQCDIALAGGGDAIDPLFAAGFRSMKALATGDDPQSACRPFDRNRTGFVLGEGAAVLIVERLRHALARGARIYAEVAASALLAEAHHVTGRVVALAESKACDLWDLPLDALQAIHPGITDKVFEVVTVEASVASRKSYGGTAPDRVREQIAWWRARN